MSRKQEVDINIKIDLEQLNSVRSYQGETNEDMKIITSLTVSQIAYLVRILYDLKIISAHNKSDMLNKIAHCLVTKSVDQISSKSLKAKFYTVDSSTKDSVHNLLLELVNRTK